MAATPVAALPAGMVEIVRSGKGITGRDAETYANTITFKKENHTGCYCAYCFCGGCLCPCGISRNHYCCTDPLWNEKCLCFSGCFFGIPYPCCLCWGEREGNVYVNREKGTRSGLLMVIDEERGTLGQYVMKSKEDTPCDTPCCYYYRC
mmetsp:Transcript_20175/g.41189  ORF Transcript_20175/g.41189 Transcript_20175/m.41189 type:complete len:149 (-) Transcript_20175:62-508(-)